MNNSSRKRFSELSWFCIGTVALLGVALSGIQVVIVTDDRRALFHELTSNQKVQDRLLQEYSRLLLERGTLLSYQNVDRIAQRRLNMLFPEQVTPVVRGWEGESLSPNRKEP
ncbi:cell division protein FtsL [Gammaproteobacteria bacterium]|nr:cell division protein FtsL [Gammaproteobacteria bacterium]